MFSIRLPARFARRLGWRCLTGLSRGNFTWSPNGGHGKRLIRLDFLRIRVVSVVYHLPRYLGTHVLKVTAAAAIGVFGVLN